MIDLSTKAGVLRFCELRRAEMVGMLRKQGNFASTSGHSFTGYAFMTHAVDGDLSRASEGLEKVFRTGRKLPRIEAFALNLPPEEDLPETFVFKERTRFFGKVIRAFAKAGKAQGVLVFGEAWFVYQSREEYEERPYGWVEESPERREGLWMKLEHSAVGWRHWQCEITRAGPLIELSPWREWSEHGGVPDKSRLSNLVDWES